LLEMMDQQAPLDSLQLVLGSQELFIKAHFKNGRMENQTILRIKRVKRVFKGLLNKFFFIQPKIPALAMGGLTVIVFLRVVCNSISNLLKYTHLSMMAIFLLYQFINAEVDKLKMR